MDGTRTQIPVWVRRSIFLWWGILVTLWLLLVVARELRSLLVQFVLALFISFALDPVIERLGRRGVGRSAATGISLLVLFAATIGFFAAMGSLLANQLNDLVDNLPGYLEQAQLWIDERFGVTINADDLQSQFEPGGEASQFATGLAGNLVGIGTTVLGLLLQTLTVTLFAYYLTADGPQLRRTICSVLPPERQRTVLSIWELAISKTGAYISSRFVLAVASAVFHGIVFQVLGLPSTVALAVWVGLISQFIPTVGTYLAGLLPMVVAIGVEPSRALWVIAAVVIYQQVENYVLQPKIAGQSLNMHPGVAIAAVLAGTELFGPAGALLALPVVATGTAFFTAYVERHDVVPDRLTGDLELLGESPGGTSGEQDSAPIG